ncbi:PLC-like phosphodiesterase, TIM beta/alpha-barrel-containing domain containing protein [Hyaloscypha variabilis]
MMFPSILATSVALLSLAGIGQAIPQQGGGNGGFGGGPQSQSSRVATTATRASTTATEAAVSTSTVACNNSPLLCNRNYNNITHMGAHDAAFLRDSSTSFSISGNQFYNATIALSAGIRLLQAQVHNSSGTLELCHTTCTLLDAGSLEAFLMEIKTWMDANTNEVVTLLLVNSDDESAATFGSVFESSGISTYGYTPTSTTGPISTWPTLQTLITANTRLVTFIASITYDSSYPYLLNEFDYVFETAFGVSSMSGFNCSLSRPTSLSSSTAAISSGYMGLLNHFADTVEVFGISIPDVTDIATTNSADTNTTGALGTQGAECDSEWGTKPTFILVDFWNVGPAIATADQLNGITATGRTSVSTAELTASSSLGVRGDAWGLGAVAGTAIAVVALVNIVWL